jgi:hypothetical protein
MATVAVVLTGRLLQLRVAQTDALTDTVGGRPAR